jgi:PAS domain S-box-containing protein
MTEPFDATAKSPFGPASVLLVDDTPANLISLRALLDDPAYSLVEARSGEEALQRVKEQEFAAILLDVRMPGLSGFDTARLIRADRRSEHTPILFLTADDIDRSMIEDGYALGAVDFFVKPLLPIAVQAKVRGFVQLFQDKQRARQQAEQLQHIQQRRAELEIKASEARTSAILATALDCIITIDHEGSVLEFNPAAERTFGYDRAEAIGRRLEELIIPPPLRQQHRDGLARYLATGVGSVLGKRLELTAVRADGSEFPVELAVTCISTDGPPLFTAYLRDLTETRRAEQRRNVRLAVSQAAEVAEGAAGILQAVCENLGWDVGFLWIVSDSGDCLQCLQACRRPNLPASEFEAVSCSRTFARGQGLPGRVWADGQPAWILDIICDENFPRLTSAVHFGLHSAFACPVMAGDKLLGVVEFFNRRIHNPDPELLEMMAMVAGNVGQFIQRKRAEEELRQSEAELADFFENATVGLHWVGPDGIILRANQAELDMLGYSREEYVGHPIADFHADGDVICDILKRLQSGQKLNEYPARLRAKDGSIKEVLIDSSVLWKRGNFVHTRCFTKDVTERNRAERQRRDAEQRLTAVFNQQFQFMAILAPDGTVEDANETCFRATGVARDQVLGRPLWATPWWNGLPDMQEQWKRYVAQVAQDGGSVTCEMQYLLANGTLRHATAVVTGLRAESGRVANIVVEGHDDTERKRNEIILAAQKRVLERLVHGAPLADVLDALCEVVEQQSQDELISTVLLLDEEGQCMRSVAGRRAPAEYASAVDGLAIGPCAGSCGTAAYRGQHVIVSDIATDPLWDNYRHLALAHGLRACWSSPILSSRDQVLGTFAVYGLSPREPSTDELRLVEILTRTAAIAIERRRAEAALAEQTVTAETLVRVGNQLSQELDLHRLVQFVTDEGTQLCDAQFGAFFYNVVNEREEACTLFAVSGVDREAFAQFSMPGNTELFSPMSKGEQIVRLADVTLDAHDGNSPLPQGTPPGLLTVRSYLALPVVSRSGEVLGRLFFGHSQPGVFTEQHERLLAAIAGQAAVAIDNVRLIQRTRASAERLNLALSAADLGDWSWDAASDVVQLSERAAAIFGISPRPQMTWRAMQELLHPDDRQRARQEVQRIIAERTQYDIEYRVNRPDGELVWVGVLGRAVYDAAGEVVGMYGVLQDISERKHLEQSLKTSEARFRGLMEQAPFSVQLFSPDGRTIQANRAWEELWGVTLQEIDGYNILQDRQLEAKGVLSYVQRAFAGEPTYIPAIQYDPEETVPSRTRHENPIRWVAAVAYPLKDDAGAVREVVLVHDDISARKRAEAALRASEEKLRLLADTIPQLAWMARPDGHIEWFNRRWFEYTGTTPEQMEGWGWQSVHDPDVLPEVVKKWQHSLATGEPFNMVFPLRASDGGFQPFLTRVNPLRDERGRILYWFGTNTDITELRQAREALAASEERLRLALDAGRMGVWDWNVRTGELKWSDSLEPLHGLTPGAFGGTFEHFEQLIHPGDRDRVQAAIQRALEQAGDFYVEFRNIWPNGAVHWIAGSGKVFCDDDGRPLRMIGIGMDITQRKRGEETARFLADASAALAELVDFDSTLQKVASLAVPYFADWMTVDVLESDGTLRRVAVAHVDPTKVQLAHDLHRRFPPDPAARNGVWNILRTAQAEIVPKINEEVLTASVKDHQLLEIMRQLGLRSYIGVPLVVRGKTRGVLTFIAAESGHLYDHTDLSVAQDLASRAAIAVDNSQLYRQLREADRRKDEFLATLAHELRNPLAPLRNGLQVMTLAHDDAVAVEQARTMMERQLAQMVRLVDDLLDVSRITRNKLELRKERVTLATVIHSAVETSRPVIEQFGHAFSVTLPPAPIHLDADPMRLAQVFSNLLNNAAKYTEPRGSIALTAETQGNEAVVCVRDTGLGIPADALPHIFDMFSQVDRNMERAQGGLGIGLTLVRRLVEMHGGTVEARSDGPGQGSEFLVRLPFVGQIPPAVALQDGEKAPSAASRRILVVDDNRDSATSLSLILKLMGNQTRIADDGLAAVEVAQQFQPDMILLDIGLPKLSGHEVCRRIRQQTWSHRTVIVALTGWGQEEDRRRSQEAGFDHHLVKPVEIAVLRELLAKVQADR